MNRGAVGVEGPVESPPFDPLYAYSLENNRPGAYWTCNIAFRKETLMRLGGFYEGFPFPHCEDRDLAFRALTLGPIGFSADMRIVHHPRLMTFARFKRRAHMTTSEIVLFNRHRARFGRYSRLPGAIVPLLGIPANWRMLAAAAAPRGPRRIARALSLGLLHTSVVGSRSLAELRRRPAPTSAHELALTPRATVTIRRQFRVHAPARGRVLSQRNIASDDHAEEESRQRPRIRLSTRIATHLTWRLEKMAPPRD